jgi:hypothetical protein
MRITITNIVLGSLAATLSGCASPYYASQPAPVYYPLHRLGIYYPAQRAGIYYPALRAAAPSDQEPARSSELRRARPPAGEQSETRQQSNRPENAGNGSGWINPEP